MQNLLLYSMGVKSGGFCETQVRSQAVPDSALLCLGVRFWLCREQGAMEWAGSGAGAVVPWALRCGEGTLPAPLSLCSCMKCSSVLVWHKSRVPGVAQAAMQWGDG